MGRAVGGPSGAPSPVLEVSVKGAGEGRVFRGWPAIVTVRVKHPDVLDAASGAIVLSLPGRPWASAVKLQATNPTAAFAKLPIHPVVPPAGPLKLEAGQAAFAAWFLTAEDTLALAEGSWELSAVLDAREPAQGAWKGNVVSEPLRVVVASEPKPLAPELVVRRQLLRADLEMLRGSPEKALAAVDELLSVQPKEPSALTLKGDLLAAAGRAEEALDSYDQAIRSIMARNPNAKEPPRGLLKKRQAVLLKVLGAKAR